MLLIRDRVEQSADPGSIIVQFEIRRRQNWGLLSTTLEQTCQNADQVPRFLGVSGYKNLIF